jgi:hypothetical protein
MANHRSNVTDYDRLDADEPPVPESGPMPWDEDDE